MYRSLASLLLVGLACLEVGGARLPTRPAPPDHGRFAHAPSQVTAPRKEQAMEATGVEEAAPGLVKRRFAKTMVLDEQGADVTHMLTLPESFAEMEQLAADQLTPIGLSVLKYDVEMSHAARVLDEDLNVLAVACAPFRDQDGVPTAPHTLTLTVADATRAATTYAVGSIVQGSTMWACVDGDNKAWTPLMLVKEVAVIDQHTLTLTGPRASYQDLFAQTNVLFRQPSLQAPTTTGSASRRPLAIQQPQRVALASQATIESFSPDAHQRVQLEQHRMHTMGNEPIFTSPVSGSSFSANDTISISFTGYSNIPDYAGKTTLQLMRYKVIGDDDELGSIAAPPCSTLVGDQCSFTVQLSQLAAVSPSLLGFYFRLQYCKRDIVGILVCQHSSSVMFWLPLVTQGSFNTNGLQTYEKSCATLADECSANTTAAKAAITPVDQAFCRLCGQGRDMRVVVGCTDCDVAYKVQVVGFTLDYSIDPLNLFIRADASVEAFVEGQLNLEADLSFRTVASGTIPVVRNLAIPPSIAIPIGVTTVTIGADFGLDVGVNLDFKTRAKATAKATMQNVITATASYDSRSSPNSVIGGTIPPFTFAGAGPVLTVEATGEAQVELILTPIISVGVSHLLFAVAQTDMTLVLHGNVSFPAFPALPGVAPNWNANPLQPAPFHYGTCETPHLIRYDVSLGLRNSFVSARLELNLASSISGLLAKYDIDKEIGRWPFDDLMFPLLAGCAAKQASSAPLTVTLDIDPTKALNFHYELDLPNLSYNLVQDLVSALNQSDARFYVAMLDAAGHYLDDAGNITAAYNGIAAAAGITGTPGGQVARAIISVVDSDQSNALSSLALQAEILAQMGDPNSKLRKTGVVTAAVVSLPQEETSSSSHTGAIVGAIIGVLLAVAIGVALAYYFLVYRKKQRAHQQTQARMTDIKTDASATTAGMEMTSQAMTPNPATVEAARAKFEQQPPPPRVVPPQLPTASAYSTPLRPAPASPSAKAGVSVDDVHLVQAAAAASPKAANRPPPPPAPMRPMEDNRVSAMPPPRPAAGADHTPAMPTRNMAAFAKFEGK